MVFAAGLAVARAVSYVGKPTRAEADGTALALSFFRFLHQEAGSIVIDGLDISQLSLTALRSRLTILPQGELDISFETEDS